MEEGEKKQLSMVAQMDQLGAALNSLAPALAQYYAALIAKQIPPEAALSLTLQIQQILFESARGSNQ